MCVWNVWTDTKPLPWLPLGSFLPLVSGRVDDVILRVLSLLLSILELAGGCRECHSSAANEDGYTILWYRSGTLDRRTCSWFVLYHGKVLNREPPGTARTVVAIWNPSGLLAFTYTPLKRFVTASEQLAVSGSWNTRYALDFQWQGTTYCEIFLLGLGSSNILVYIVAVIILHWYSEDSLLEDYL